MAIRTKKPTMAIARVVLDARRWRLHNTTAISAVDLIVLAAVIPHRAIRLAGADGALLATIVFAALHIDVLGRRRRRNEARGGEIRAA